MMETFLSKLNCIIIFCVIFFPRYGSARFISEWDFVLLNVELCFADSVADGIKLISHLFIFLFFLCASSGV